ncbi:hypothetical protein PSQ90_08925 [Devosia rhodophyticola]|uniref:Uncharacterized protein n=1 Tax=Devosia rhodophyticola TaxID=3026423 RepID=A0ABY7YT35_9HYPH|nr:hypothetical protein [Devosia rhodophyticola]WDR04469.1 hypothetical protein PSQ90_08925 [Devosia rhodophyticola]
MKTIGLSIAALVVGLCGSVVAQESDDPALLGELLGFHGTETIVLVMTTHCYETTGLDSSFKSAAENWYLRNVGFLELADRVIDRLGGQTPAEAEAARNYSGAQIMSAYNQAEDKDGFCRGFLGQVEDGKLDIDQQLPQILKQAQAIASE